MGNGISVIALPQWYREWATKYGKLGFITASESLKWDVSQDAADLSGKVHLITGSNCGIGFEAAKEVSRRKGTVHMLCRNAERGEAARLDIIAHSGNPQVYLHAVDVSSIASVRAFSESFLANNKKIDVLVNNAGILAVDREQSEDGIESCLAVALGGTYLLTSLLLPALRAASPSVVINVTSAGMYLAKTDVHDLQISKVKTYDGFLQYCRVKRAQVELSEIFTEKLAKSGVSFHSMHPGYAVTPGVEKLPAFGTKEPGGFIDQHGPSLRSAAQGADTISWMASAPSVRATSGLLFFDRQPTHTSFPLTGTTLSKKEKEILWEECGKLMGYVPTPPL
mmetsp:Transcript_72729/g.117971  ORF Transcript_72729/g.117971 Transcript_72729/m.117971 type:complete len:338 (+) Transcript_72729:126-1139(+)|eukprot:CAMPEP_0179422046 /NCGR_PEP_ID=MMETSP0799-20121207/10188_1 /TAXON_ID=46947 /ORGANISM="Geminigera cryophila, Strain CCMP2564" /LENGTH=337 /DNA_ID=CAMNT_0021196089 /DNA_START=121 /DNA_END=1134 /DNA_ORIENTATION=+